MSERGRGAAFRHPLTPGGRAPGRGGRGLFWRPGPPALPRAVCACGCSGAFSQVPAVALGCPWGGAGSRSAADALCAAAKRQRLLPLAVAPLTCLSCARAAGVGAGHKKNKTLWHQVPPGSTRRELDAPAAFPRELLGAVGRVTCTDRFEYGY